jgi:hypothetical protein
MEIKVSEIYEKEKDLIKVYDELTRLILGKNIELFEYNEDSKDYELINNYEVQSVQIWEEDQIAFTFGPDEWDICSIKETDLIKIK